MDTSWDQNGRVLKVVLPHLGHVHETGYAGSVRYGACCESSGGQVGRTFMTSLVLCDMPAYVQAPPWVPASACPLSPTPHVPSWGPCWCGSGPCCRLPGPS